MGLDVTAMWKDRQKSVWKQNAIDVVYVAVACVDVGLGQVRHFIELHPSLF